MQHSRLGDADAYYTGFVTRPLEPVLWHLLFAACCCGIVAFGVSKGIERISKIFLPVLLLTLIAIGGYALTLPGASQGLRFLFRIFPKSTAFPTLPPFWYGPWDRCFSVSALAWAL